jgi:hypothetical protein
VVPRRSPARALLRLFAAALLFGTLAYWWSAGAHRGWSQDQVPIQKTDEVTGIDYLEYERRFVPGVEVLGLGMIMSLLFFTPSFFIGKPKSK